MKYKIINKKKMMFAGVSSYVSNEGYSTEDSKKKSESTFSLSKEDIQKFKESALKYKDSVLNSLTEIIREDDHGVKTDFKEYSDNDVSVEDETVNFTMNDEADDDLKFDNTNDFGIDVEKLAAKIEKLGQKMERQGNKFAKRMNQFGESMDALSKHLSDDLENMMANDSDKKYEDEPNSELDFSKEELQLLSLNQLVYEKYIMNKPFDITPEDYYTIQLLDLGVEEKVKGCFIGSKVSYIEDLQYPVNVMVLDPDKWLVVKCTEDEYNKSWMDKLSKAQRLKDYTIGEYFITTHGRVNEYEEIKIYCPLFIRD